MSKLSDLATLGLLGVGGFLLVRSVSAENSPSPMTAMTSPTPQINITVPDRRVEGKLAPQDVGTTKIIPIVSNKSSTDRTGMSKTAKTADVIRYNTAPTAIEKIRASVKVLPKKQAEEQASNLAKLGWA